MEVRFSPRTLNFKFLKRAPAFNDWNALNGWNRPRQLEVERLEPIPCPSLNLEPLNFELLNCRKAGAVGARHRFSFRARFSA
jgi:hypothetical protein